MNFFTPLFTFSSRCTGYAVISKHDRLLRSSSLQTHLTLMTQQLRHLPSVIVTNIIVRYVFPVFNHVYNVTQQTAELVQYLSCKLLKQIRIT